MAIATALRGFNDHECYVKKNFEHIEFGHKTMPSLKNLTKELRQEIVSYLFPFPPISNNLAFRLAILIFAKTRFCSHINFIGRCLHS